MIRNILYNSLKANKKPIIRFYIFDAKNKLSFCQDIQRNVVSPLDCDKWSSAARAISKESPKDPEGYSPVDAKVEDTAAVHNEVVGLVVGEGHGGGVVDTDNDVLHPESSLVSNTALGHLKFMHMVSFRYVLAVRFR